MTEPRQSLHATFDVGGDPARVFNRLADQISAPSIILPFGHREAARDGAKWNATAIILGPTAQLERDAEALLAARPKGMKRLALMQQQPGLDMVFAKENGARTEPRMIQWIEYVFSDPERREDYYRSQEDTSGPAMRELWERGLVGRFIGFENPQLLYCAPGFVNWDVLHVIGMTPWQLLRFMPRMGRTFDRHAKAAGRGGRKAMFARWEEQRDIIKLTSKQSKEATRHSIEWPSAQSS